MRHTFLLFTFALLLICPAFMVAQNESTTIFNFLRLPTSSHVTALGGANVSLYDEDASLLFQNPSLMSNAPDRAINLGFFTYMQGIKAGNAAWTMASGERGTWGVGAQFVGYGSMKEMSIEGLEMGDFSALDMALCGGYSYTLTDRLAGGVTGKFVYSKYGPYTSVALAVDLGLNYLNTDNGFSASLVAANLGGQVKPFGDTREHLPIDIRAGFTKQLAKAPIRFSVTLVDLTSWTSRSYYNPSRETEKAGRIILNHFVVGVDILPIDILYISAGYNFRRAAELKAAGSTHGAGLTFGAGVNLKKFSLGMAYAKYHVSTPSFMITAQYHL